MPLCGERGLRDWGAPAEGCKPAFRSHEASKYNLYEKEDEMFLYQHELMLYTPRQRNQILRAPECLKGKKTHSLQGPATPRMPYRHHVVLEQLCRCGAQLTLTDCLNVWRLLRGEGRGGVVTCIQGFWKRTEMQTECESSRSPWHLLRHWWSWHGRTWKSEEAHGDMLSAVMLAAYSS